MRTMTMSVFRLSQPVAQDPHPLLSTVDLNTLIHRPCYTMDVLELHSSLAQRSSKSCKSQLGHVAGSEDTWSIR